MPHTNAALTQDRKKYETERHRAGEKKGTQYPKKERAERFKEPRSDRTVVEAASYEATKGTDGSDEQAALLQDRKWSTLNGVTLAQAVKLEKFAIPSRPQPTSFALRRSGDPRRPQRESVVTT